MIFEKKQYYALNLTVKKKGSSRILGEKREIDINSPRFFHFLSIPYIGVMDFIAKPAIAPTM